MVRHHPLDFGTGGGDSALASVDLHDIDLDEPPSMGEDGGYSLFKEAADMKMEGRAAGDIGAVAANGLWDVTSLDEAGGSYSRPEYSPGHSVSVTVVPTGLSPLFSRSRRAIAPLLDEDIRGAASLLHELRSSPRKPASNGNSAGGHTHVGGSDFSSSDSSSASASPKLWVASPSRSRGGSGSAGHTLTFSPSEFFVAQFMPVDDKASAGAHASGNGSVGGSKSPRTPLLTHAPRRLTLNEGDKTGGGLQEETPATDDAVRVIGTATDHYHITAPTTTGHKKVALSLNERWGGTPLTPLATTHRPDNKAAASPSPARTPNRRFSPMKKAPSSSAPMVGVHLRSPLFKRSAPRSGTQITLGLAGSVLGAQLEQINSRAMQQH